MKKKNMIYIILGCLAMAIYTGNAQSDALQGREKTVFIVRRFQNIWRDIYERPVFVCSEKPGRDQ